MAVIVFRGKYRPCSLECVRKKKRRRRRRMAPEQMQQHMTLLDDPC